MTNNDTPRRPNVFISHTWKDMDFTKRVVEQLKEWGYNVWWDYEQLRGDKDIWTVVDELINACDVFIVLLSKSALESRGVIEEIKWAHYRTLNKNGNGKLLQYMIPVIIRDCDFKDILRICTRTWVKLVRRWEKGFNELHKLLPLIPISIDEPVKENKTPESLPELTENESNIRKVLSLLGDAYSSVYKEHIDVVIGKFEAAEKEAISIGDERIQLEAKFNICIYKVNFDDTKDSFKLLDECLALAIKLNDNHKIAEIERNIGWIHHRLGNLDKALEQYQKSYNYFEKINDSWGKSVSLGNIAIINSMLGMHDIAKQQYDECIKIMLELKDYHGLATSYTNKASEHQLCKENEKANILYKKAYNIFKALDHKVGQGRVLANIAYTNFTLGKINEAINSCYDALDIIEVTGDKIPKGAVYCNLGIIIEGIGEFDKALPYYIESIKISEEIDDLYTAANSSYNVALIFVEVYRNPKDALKYAEKAFEYYEKIGVPESKKARNLVEELKKILKDKK